MGTAATEGEELAVMEAPHRRPRRAVELCTGGVAATELRVGWRSGHWPQWPRWGRSATMGRAVLSIGKRNAPLVHEDGRGKWTVVTEMVAPWRWPWMRKGGDRVVVVNCVVRCSTDYGYCIEMIMAEGG
ncbi:2-deoxycytidine 5-triphosphate deaminase [Sesbania bispinosa]|nr:2-deoxycytidine 5-triphosphate deaminase [Sesbania bispinosa]